MKRFQFALVFLLILGLHLAAASKVEEELDDDVSDEGISDGKEDTSEEDDEENEEVENQIMKTLTKDICIDALHRDPKSPVEELCCKAHFEVGEEARECGEAFMESKRTDEKANHDLAYCVFTKKNYTRGTENLNFKRINADLEKLPDPQERNHFKRLYKTCSRKVKPTVAELKKMTKSGKIAYGLKHPFFYLVMVCISSYTQTTSCPYFLWQKDICLSYMEKCKELWKRKHA